MTGQGYRKAASPSYSPGVEEHRWEEKMGENILEILSTNSVAWWKRDRGRLLHAVK